MKNTKLILTISLTVLLSVWTQAQSTFHDYDHEFRRWKYYDAVASAQSSNHKTTNTVKQIKASSFIVNNVYRDSFLVTRPRVGGSSRLQNADFYLDHERDPSASPLSLYGLAEASHVDYLRALHFHNNLSQVDSFSRYYYSNGYLWTFDKVLQEQGRPDYNRVQSGYSWDGQGRPVSYNQLFIGFTGDVRQIDVANYYDASGNYFKSNSYYQSGGNTRAVQDSIVVNNGKVTSVYSTGNTPPFYARQYSYDANGLPSELEIYADGDLIVHDMISSRLNSDFPDSFTHYLFQAGDTVDMVHGVYSFDPSTGHLMSYSESSFDPASDEHRQCNIITDADGDIIRIDWFEDSGYIWGVMNIYYEDPTAIISQSEFSATIEAYPVPSTDYVQLTSSEYFDGYALYDVSGRLLHSSQFTLSREHQIDLSDYIPGIYILEVHSEGRTKSVEIQKL